jgi:hypothetical protein
MPPPDAILHPNSPFKEEQKTMTSPTQDPKAMALAVISNAAQTNTATATNPDMSVYAAAGVTGVIGYAMSAYNSTLNTATINGAATSTTAQVQSIVNAYNDIIGLSLGYSGSPLPVPTAAQFATIGVTGVQDAKGGGNALYLLDQSLFGNYNTASTVAGVQALANAANHVMAAAGGTAAEAATLSLMDFSALGITGVTATNLAAVQQIIRSATSDTQVDMRYEIQDRINANLGTSASSALNLIGNAAEDNSATAPTLAAKIFATAGITGVDSSNLPSIYSALNSEAIGLLRASRPAELQALVDSYKAILQSADGVAGNTATPLTAAQYSAIGVTGVSGVTALHLLNDVVDASARAKVDTVPELQALANAAAHVMAGMDVSLVDLRALGISGVTATNLGTIQAALQANVNGSAIDTKGELQAMVNAAIASATPTGKALATISAAAENNTAVASSLSTSIYSAAGVTGVSAANLASVSSALDSAVVRGVMADTTAEVQAIVNAYNAILASADGVAGNTATPLTAAQYSTIGVVGVTGTATAGSAMSLLNSVVDANAKSGVDTVAEVQAMADAATHVITTAGGTSAQAATLSLADLTALGIHGVTAANLATVQAAVQATNADAMVDTQAELQTLVNTALSGVPAALNAISTAAETNTAVASGLSANVYSAAGVTGVSAANIASVNSALDSAKVNGAAADTTAEVQAIVNAYGAVLANADGVHGNAKLPITLAQYAAIGVTGISDAVATPVMITDDGAYFFGTGADQTADQQSGSIVEPSGLTLNVVIPNGGDWHLLNDVVDASARSAVDTVAEVQSMATAANHVIAAAGGSMEQAAAVTLADLHALGIHGVTAANLVTVQAALELTGSDFAVDTQAELQSLVDTALPLAPWALHSISAAAEFDTASSGKLRLELFGLAGVTGVNTGNWKAIYSALDSSHVNVALTDSVVEVQAIVDSYTAILHSADGVGGNTVSALTAHDYTNIGVTGVAEATDYIVYEAPVWVELGLIEPGGSPFSSVWTNPYPGGINHVTQEGTALHLLNDVVDSFAKTGVDTVPGLQAMADAANHIIAAAGGTLAAARAITHADLFALGIGYGDESSITNLQDALHALTSSAAVDTRAELGSLAIKAQYAQLTVFTDLPAAPVEQPQPDLIGCIDLRFVMQPSFQPVMMA